MDRECGKLAFNPFEQGWDWFGVQLDDHRELMIYGLRDKDGRPSPQAHAVCIEPDGRRIVLTADEFRLTPRSWWTSSRTGCRYPVAWTLSIPQFAAELSIEPFMRNHELDTGGSTSVNYWEGPAAVRGSWNDRPATGRCFAELVGYDRKSHSGRFDFYTASFSFAGLLRSEMSRWATRSGTINID
jgi:predicted secreted hydrolase